MPCSTIESPNALSQVNHAEAQAQALEAELDVLDALHAMGPTPTRRGPRKGMEVRLRYGRRVFRRE